jgi:cyclophilin family peptidyl-prolyl cis-trans isomerase
MSRICRRLCELISIAVLSLSACPVVADDSPTRAVQNKVANSSLEAFREKLVEWNKLRDQTQRVLTKSQGPVSPEELRSLEEAERPLLRQMIALCPEVTKLAEAAWLEKPVTDPKVFEWLDGEIRGALIMGRYLEAYQIGNVILQREEHLDATQRSNSLRLAAMSSFSVNQFDSAKAHLESLQKVGGKANLLATDKIYIVRWRAEQEIRARESRSNNLPRVNLQITKGDVIIELFKNDAPDTVSEFIAMIEAQKLNNVPLKTISDGMVTAMQISADDSTLNVIKSEVSRSSHRLHFHGSLSVGKFDSSTGTTIVVSLKPVPEWDAKNTVFGRVVQGMPALEETLHGDREKPDRIIQATILRK